MIEMLGVLAIIGVLSAGGIMGYSTAMDNYRVKKTNKDIATMITKADTLFKNHSTSTTDKIILIPDLCRLGIISNDYCQTLSGNCTSEFNCFVTSPFNTPMRIYYWEYFSNDHYRLFYLRIYDLDKKQCIKLMTHNWKLQFPHLHSFAFRINDGANIVNPSLAQAEEYCTQETTPIQYNFWLSKHQ